MSEAYRRLLLDLHGIIADAARATAADDARLEREQPSFGRLLDAKIPTYSAQKRAANRRIAAGVQRVGGKRRRMYKQDTQT